MNLNKEVASLLQYDGPHLVRDRFNTRKLILATTANGKVSKKLTECNIVFISFADVCFG